MESLIQKINIEALSNCESLKNCDKQIVSSLIDELKKFQKNLRINIEDSVKCTRKTLEYYLHAKYPEQGNIELASIVHNLSANKTIDINDYKVLTILRILGNQSEHDTGIDYTRFTQSIVLRMFLLFLGLIEQDYDKYFSNLSDVVNKSEEERKANTQTPQNSGVKDISWVFVFVERLNPNYAEDEIYNFPINEYEIVEKYPTDYGVDNLFENYTYKVKTGQEYHYVIPVKDEKLVSKREEDVNNIIRNNTFSQNFLEYETSLTYTTYNKQQNLSYRIYKLRKNTERLDKYLETNEVSQLDALKMIKQICDVFCEFKNLHHRSLDEKAIFVNKINNDHLLQISSFKYAKVAGEWELEINDATVSPAQIRELRNHANHFSIVGENENLLEDYRYFKTQPTEITNEIYEKFDVYSLVVLLAYIMDKKTGVSEKLNANVFRGWNLYSAVSDMINANTFDEIIDMKTLRSLLEKEINANN